MPDPKDRQVTDPDSFGPGMRADGSVNVMAPEQAAIARAARDAEEAVFDNEDDDVDDLDDLELDDHL